MSNNADIKKVFSRSLRHSMNLENIDEVFDLNPTDDVRNCYRHEFPIQFYLITCYQHYYFNYKPSLHHYYFKYPHVFMILYSIIIFAIKID